MGELRQVELCIRTYIVGVRWRATQEMEQIFTLADNSVPLTKSKLLIDTVANATYMSKNNGLEKFAIS